MTKGQKILVVIGILVLTVGGFALAKFLTRNVKNIRGGVVILQEYDTPANEEPLSSDDENTEEKIEE